MAKRVKRIDDRVRLRQVPGRTDYETIESVNKVRRNLGLSWQDLIDHLFIRILDGRIDLNR